MPTPLPERRFRFAAALALALVLAVVLASAAIRLGSASGFLSPEDVLLKGLRAVHRASASAEVLVALWLGWMAWQARRERADLARGAALALVLTVFLSLLGIAAGRDPSPPAALGNVLGGLLLAATFSWMLAAVRRGASQPFHPALIPGLAVMLALQCVVGARVSVLSLKAPSVQIHALLGVALAALLVWLAVSSKTRLLVVLAVLAPLAGFTVLQYEHSSLAAFVHAAAAAALVVAGAFVLRKQA